jgi:hypothetical protein
MRAFPKAIFMLGLLLAACAETPDVDPSKKEIPAMTQTKTIQDATRKSLYERSLTYDATLDAKGLATLWHPEGSVQIGAQPRVTGREAVGAFFKTFFSYGLFKKLEHEMVEVWDLPDLIYQAVAIYTLPDDTVLRIPYVNVVKYKEGLFFDYKVFIDTKPLLK